MNNIKPWVRVIILVSAVVILGFLSLIITGKFIPVLPADTMIFQSAILMVVLGTTFLENHFTKPADSLVNSFTALITLLPVLSIYPKALWWILLAYNLIVFTFSVICVISVPSKNNTNYFIYRLAITLGSAKILFSIMFICSIIAFYGIQSINTFIMVAFWGLFIVIWPLKIPELISSIILKKGSPRPIGSVNRIDWPNLLRVIILPDSIWTPQSLKLHQDQSGDQSIVIPLFSEPQSDQTLGTGLCVKTLDEKVKGLKNGFVYDLPTQLAVTYDELIESFSGSLNSPLIGFITENSTIQEIHFEVWNPEFCYEGKLVWVKIGNRKIHYQVSNGLNDEESFHANKHGFQTAYGVQLGEFTENVGFTKYLWIPQMNTPVFGESSDFGKDQRVLKPHDLVIGTIPGTMMEIGGPFADYFTHHTAILGVTGAGKTELAFDVIKYAVAQNIKVICIDLTSKYNGKLIELNPLDLSLSEERSRVLSEKIFNVETGTFGAPLEKKQLKEFIDPLQEEIAAKINSFLSSTDGDAFLGILNLEDISNTKATLWITELYLSHLLSYARVNMDTMPRTLIVVEEAHTVMPEPNMMGLGDNDSKGMVSKISQIALQGRKYNIGLLVIAQRTATVSKSILSQCNTIISFNCFDDTSLHFLENYYGKSYTSLVPNLPFLSAIAYGKWIRSQRPLIFQIPFDEEKAKSNS